MKLYIKSRDCDNAPSYAILNAIMEVKYNIKYELLLDVPMLKILDITGKELGIMIFTAIARHRYIYTRSF